MPPNNAVIYQMSKEGLTEQTLIRNGESQEFDIIDIVQIFDRLDKTGMIAIITYFPSIKIVRAITIIPGDLHVDDGLSPVFDNQEIRLPQATIGYNARF